MMTKNNQKDSEFLKETKEKIAFAMACWDDLEIHLKEAKSVHEHVIIPALNELRYAARSLINISQLVNSKQRFSSAERLNVHDKITTSLAFMASAERDLVDSVFLLLQQEFDEYS